MIADKYACLMFQATISVGGRTHSAMSIEHFILRLPYSAKQVRPCLSRSIQPCPCMGAAVMTWIEWLVSLDTYTY